MLIEWKDSQVEVLNDGFEDLVDASIEVDSEVASACNEDDGGVQEKPGGVLGCWETGEALDSGELGAASVPGGLGLCQEVGEVF